jgi:hypothetical protein
LAPAWAELGDAYAGSGSVVIGDVDCTIEEDLCAKFEVRGYPTLKYWKDGTDREREAPDPSARLPVSYLPCPCLFFRWKKSHGITPERSSSAQARVSSTNFLRAS